MALAGYTLNFWEATGRFEGRRGFLEQEPLITLMAENRERKRLHFPRTTLLVEIERRCQLPECTARNQIGLTKQEAIEYRGFECFQCQRWNDDRASASEFPDSWAISD
jgi:hypothetical protein